MVTDIDHKHYDSKSFVFLEDAFLESEDIVKLLGIYIDKKLNFEHHIKSLLLKIYWEGGPYLVPIFQKAWSLIGPY